MGNTVSLEANEDSSEYNFNRESSSRSRTRRNSDAEKDRKPFNILPNRRRVGDVVADLVDDVGHEQTSGATMRMAYQGGADHVVLVSDGKDDGVRADVDKSTDKSAETSDAAATRQASQIQADYDDASSRLRTIAIQDMPTVQPGESRTEDTAAARLLHLSASATELESMLKTDAEVKHHALVTKLIEESRNYSASASSSNSSESLNDLAERESEPQHFEYASSAAVSPYEVLEGEANKTSPPNTKSATPSYISQGDLAKHLASSHHGASQFQQPATPGSELEHQRLGAFSEAISPVSHGGRRPPSPIFQHNVTPELPRERKTSENVSQLTLAPELPPQATESRPRSLWSASDEGDSASPGGSTSQQLSPTARDRPEKVHSTRPKQLRLDLGPDILNTNASAVTLPTPAFKDSGFVQSLIRNVIDFTQPDDEDSVILLIKWDVDLEDRTAAHNRLKRRHPQDAEKNKLIPHTVYVCGTFSRWKTKVQLLPDSLNSNRYVAVIAVPPGPQRLKFIIDGKWCTSRNLPVARDINGSLINYMTFRSAYRPLANRPSSSGQQDLSQRPSSSSSSVGTALSSARLLEDDKEWSQTLPPELALWGEWEKERDAVEDAILAKLGPGDPPPSVDLLPPPPWIGNVPPPQLPVQLEKGPLNYSQFVPRGSSDDNSVLPKPDHSVINHLAASPIKNGVLNVGITSRYKEKFVTIVYCKSAKPVS